MSAVNTTSLESAVSLIRNRFLKKSWEARSDESVTVAFEIHRCISATSDADRFKSAYELLESALGRWREGFARVAVESFRELCSLAFANPALVAADPVEWARTKIEVLIGEELDGNLSSDVQWRAEAEAKADPVERHVRALVNRLTPPECQLDSMGVRDLRKPGRHLGFYMRACEGSDLLPTHDSPGQPEVWLAPSWVGGRPVLGRPWSDERTTVTVTNTVLRLARSGFEHRAKYVLDDAVEKAQIDLVCRPIPSAKPQGKDARKRSDAVSTRRDEWTALNEDHSVLVKLQAIQLDKKGPEYCKFLEENNPSVRTSIKWVKRGCPRSYPEAYKIPRWQELIHKEKSRVKRDWGWILNGSPFPMHHLSVTELLRIRTKVFEVSRSPRETSQLNRMKPA